MDYVWDMIAYIACLLVWIRFLPYLKRDSWHKKNRTDKAVAPVISIIIPARNEASVISRLLVSLLQMNYQKLEIIVVDDRSEDHTRQISEQFPVQLITAPIKPEGWIGKSWACYIGAKSAKGSILLFTDADTTHTPESLQHAIAYIKETKSDMISAPAYHLNKNWWEKLLGPFYCLIHSGASPYDEVSTDNAYALGQYLMIERDVYFKCGGHQAVHEEIADDAALARTVMKAGYRYKMYNGPRLCEVQMYNSPKSFCEGWLRILRLGLKELRPAGLLLTLLPLLALNFQALENLTLVSWVPAFATLVCFYFVQKKIGTFSILGLILFPLPVFLFVALSCLAMVSQLLRLPMHWRGRIYNTQKDLTIGNA